MSFGKKSLAMPDDRFHGHEALHTAYVIGDMVDRHLVNSHFVRQDADLARAARDASAALATLYQLIGAKVPGP